jgi:hypothetical protein
MTDDYERTLMKTPGEIGVPVNIINLKHPIRQAGRTFTVPLVDESGVYFAAKLATERIGHKRDCPILVTGDRGIGKSTFINKCGQVIDSFNKADPDLKANFGVDKIAFRLEEFDQIFNTNPAGDGEKGIYPQVVMDEAGHALYGPEWLAKEQRIIAKELIISRIKRQILWMAVPKRKQFNNQIRDMAYIWVHISEPKEYLQGYGVVRLAPAHLQSEFHSEKYWEPKYAFTFTAESGPFWDKYEEKKIKFVDEVTRDTASGKARSEKTIKARDVVVKAYYNYRKQHKDPITLEELGQLLNLGTTMVWNILNDKN